MGCEAIMDPSAPPYPDTPVPVQSLCPALPTTKRPWSPPLLTAESTSATAHQKVQGPEDGPRDGLPS